MLFILALRGLSSPATSRRGNTLGMVGMAVACELDRLRAPWKGTGDPRSA